jgi:hypothetical protein
VGPPRGRWFGSPRGARHALAAAVTALLATAVFVVVNEPVRRAPPWLPSLPPAIRGGLLPAAAAVLAVLLAGWISRRRGATRVEAVQSAFTFVAVSLAVLTVVGVVFRGPGMVLAWP